MEAVEKAVGEAVEVEGAEEKPHVDEDVGVEEQRIFTSTKIHGAGQCLFLWG